MEMGGSSNAPDVSAPTQDLKYIQALTVNVSNFVSVKLSSRINYKIWKAQMLCLLKSQVLLHIIDTEYPFPGDKGVHMIAQYDQLVKGWIFSTMSDHVLDNLADIDSSRDIWIKLESLFGLSICSREDVSSDARDVLSAQTEDMKYMLASTVNASNFVSVKLSGPSNYVVWKTQMLCLIESHDLLHMIFGKDRWKRYHDPMTIKYGKLVIGWIFSTMNPKMVDELRLQECKSIEFVWRRLESTFMESDIEDDASDEIEDPRYARLLTYDLPEKFPMKLSGRINYKEWKKRMLDMLEEFGLRHIIDVKYLLAGDKYDNLVKTWILGTMNSKVRMDFAGYSYSANHLWKKLKSRYSAREGVTSPGFMFRTEFEGVPEIDDMDNKDYWYEVAVEGCWWKAKSILKLHKNAATEAITTENGNTILHVAVEMGHNYFVEKLLEFLEDGKDIETQNVKGQTALHIAALVGNTYAAQLLVQKRKQLLEILDYNEQSPFNIASANTKLHISSYLFKSLPPSDSRNYSFDYQESALLDAIFTKQYDLAEKLLMKFDEFAVTHGVILKAITLTFPTDLGYSESFIYPSFLDVRQKIIRRGSLLFHPSFLDKCVDEILRFLKIYNNTCCRWLEKKSVILHVLIVTLCPVYQLTCLLMLLLRLPLSMFYFLIWKFLAVTVGPIKNIEKNKKDYKEAKKILSLVCEQMGKFNDGYGGSLFEAVRQGTYEVVDEILFMSPATIKCKDEEGHNIIQSAIINRSEKVYNLIYHIIDRTESYKEITDSSENTLVHLAGRLAPSFVLDRTVGAALQLQRELLWREEVEKLVSPLQHRLKNSNNETPAMVFTREHQDLMKQGELWMKTTAESCSITAALIVTVVFAAAITVPGGSNQESGIPVFKKETAFTIFAVSNAFSLFTAATALLLFLSILTARFSEKDFVVSLPRRLIFGLLMLFLSTTAMLIAFGAILFLVFCDQRPWMLAPICGFACLPISVIVTIKLPLLVDVSKSTYFPIFGKPSYLESCKTNRKNTIFTE